MTYMVTGGTGFIGSHIVRELVHKGQQVIVYDWQPERHGLERLLSEEELANSVKIVHGDVTNFSLLCRALKENKVDRIFHMAGMLTLEVNSNPLLGVKVNCEGTANVFEAARLLDLKKVVWPSSGSVYGPAEMYPQEYIPNNAPHYPQSLYGASKSFDEMLADYYTKNYGIDITGLRFVMVYGAGQLRGRGSAIMKQLLFNPALGKPGKVPAAADNLLGWTYIEDAVRAALIANDVSRPKTKIFSVRGDLHTVEQLADFVKELFPHADITLLPMERSASYTTMTCKYDTQLIETELGFYCQWKIKEGIRETANRVRDEHGLPPV